jgi:hypothetical protein
MHAADLLRNLLEMAFVDMVGSWEAAARFSRLQRRHS